MRTKAPLSIVFASIFSGIVFSAIVNVSYAAVSGKGESDRHELEEQILSSTVRIMIRAGWSTQMKAAMTSRPPSGMER